MDIRSIAKPSWLKRKLRREVSPNRAPSRPTASAVCKAHRSPSLRHFAQASRRVRIEPFETRQVLCKQLDGYGA